MAAAAVPKAAAFRPNAATSKRVGFQSSASDTAQTRIVELELEIGNVEEYIDGLLQAAEERTAGASASAFRSSSTGTTTRIGSSGSSAGSVAAGGRRPIPGTDAETTHPDETASPSINQPPEIRVLELESRVSIARTLAMTLAGRAGEHLLDPTSDTGGDEPTAKKGPGAQRANKLKKDQLSSNSLFSIVSSSGGRSQRSLLSKQPSNRSSLLSKQPSNRSFASSFGGSSASGDSGTSPRSPRPAPIDTQNFEVDRITGRRPRSEQQPTAPIGFMWAPRPDTKRSIRQRKIDADLAARRAEEDAALAFRFVAQPVPPTTSKALFTELEQARAATRNAEHKAHYARLASTVRSFPGIDTHTAEHIRRTEALRTAAREAEDAALAAAVRLSATPAPPSTWQPHPTVLRMRERESTRAARLRTAAEAFAAASALPHRMAQALEDDMKKRDARLQRLAQEVQRDRAKAAFRAPHGPPDFEALQAAFQARVVRARTARPVTQPVGFRFNSRAAANTAATAARPVSALPASRTHDNSASSSSLRVRPQSVSSGMRPPPVRSVAEVINFLSHSSAPPIISTRASNLRALETKKRLQAQVEEQRAAADADAAYSALVRAATLRVAPIVESLEAHRLQAPLAWQTKHELGAASERRQQFLALSIERKAALDARIQRAQESLPLLMLRYATPTQHGSVVEQNTGLHGADGVDCSSVSTPRGAEARLRVLQCVERIVVRAEEEAQSGGKPSVAAAAGVQIDDNDGIDAPTVHTTTSRSHVFLQMDGNDDSDAYARPSHRRLGLVSSSFNEEERALLRDSR